MTQSAKGPKNLSSWWLDIKQEADLIQLADNYFDGETGPRWEAVLTAVGNDFYWRLMSFVCHLKGHNYINCGSSAHETIVCARCGRNLTHTNQPTN